MEDCRSAHLLKDEIVFGSISDDGEDPIRYAIIGYCGIGSMIDHHLAYADTAIRGVDMIVVNNRSDEVSNRELNRHLLEQDFLIKPIPQLFRPKDEISMIDSAKDVLMTMAYMSPMMDKLQEDLSRYPKSGQPWYETKGSKVKKNLKSKRRQARQNRRKGR